MQTRLRSPSKDASTDHCPPPRTILGAGLQPHTGPFQEAHTRLHGCALHGCALHGCTERNPCRTLFVIAPDKKQGHSPPGGDLGRPCPENKMQTRLRSPAKDASTDHFPAGLPQEQSSEQGFNRTLARFKKRTHGCTVVHCTERDSYRAR